MRTRQCDTQSFTIMPLALGARKRVRHFLFQRLTESSLPRIRYKYADGTSREVDVPVGRSVMLGATTNGLPGIDADCGGTLSCATCHVYVDPAWAAKLPPPDQTETDLMFGVAAEQRSNSRLSCQIVITEELEGLVVEVPSRQS